MKVLLSLSLLYKTIDKNQNVREIMTNNYWIISCDAAIKINQLDMISTDLIIKQKLILLHFMIHCESI